MNTIRFFAFAICLFCWPALLGAQSWERWYPELAGNANSDAVHSLPLADGRTLSLIRQDFIPYDYQNFYLAELGTDGSVEQLYPFLFPGIDRAVDLISTADGGYLILYTITQSSSQVRPALLKLDAQFQQEWRRELTGTGSSYATSVLELANGGYAVLAKFQTAPPESRQQIFLTDAGGSLLSEMQWGNTLSSPSDLVKLPSGGFIAIGNNQVWNSSDSYINLARFDAAGMLTDTLIFNPGFNASVYDGLLTTNGDLAVCGYGTGGVGAFFIRMDLNFNILTVSTLPQYLLLRSMATIAGSDDIWAIPAGFGWPKGALLRLDANGALLYEKELGGPAGYTLIGRINAAPNGGCLLSGQRDLPNNPDLRRAFVARTDSSGNGFNSGVSPSVWLDQNSDCVLNADSLLYGWTLNAWNADGLAWSAVSDSAGGYFLPLAPGDYQLTAERPNGAWLLCADTLAVTVLPNDTLTGIDFLLDFDPQPIDSLFGYVFSELDGDCKKDLFEPGLAGWTVTAIYQDLDSVEYTLSTSTDSSGYYQLEFVGITNAVMGAVSINPPPNDGLTCYYPCGKSLPMLFFEGDSLRLDFGVHCDSLPPCPVIEVDIATNVLRPCSTSVYSVHFCNNGAVLSENTEVVVTFDVPLEVTGASIPWTTVVGNAYTFPLGSLLPEDCGDFTIDVQVPCDAMLGATFCAEAHAHPDTICLTPGPNWDGSQIEVSVECTGDSVIFTIQNVGDGNMSQALNYIVIEDNVLLKPLNSGFQLNAGAAFTVSFEATGVFYRLESEQSPGFPGLTMPVAWVEGCTPGGDPISLGYLNQYSLPDEEPWLDIFCQEVVNSFDPNDKTGFPLGYDDEHFIEANTDLEYLIRFQNTGTAPAILVEIRDTIPLAFLDPATVRPGASSHPYEFDMQGSGVVVFRFPGINLPDSASNPELSQGFVKFRVSQKANLPSGTVIPNTAAIYFDNNAPVITNETWHRIGYDFILVAVQGPGEPGIELLLAPNPMTQWVRVQTTGLEPSKPLQFRLLNAVGQPVLDVSPSSSTFDFNAGGLPGGVYFYELYAAGKRVGFGKVITIRN